MSSNVRSLATYADLDRSPEGANVELIRGSLHSSPRPSSRQTRAGSRLGYLLGPFDDESGDGSGGWIILDEPELRIAGDCLIPDLAGWRRSTMPELPDVPAFDLSPDWICVVLSDSTAAYDRAEKLPVYASWGVTHAWLVDPRSQTLEVFRLDTGAWRLVTTFAGECRVRAEPFDAMELELGRLWAR